MPGFKTLISANYCNAWIFHQAFISQLDKLQVRMCRWVNMEFLHLFLSYKVKFHFCVKLKYNFASLRTRIFARFRHNTVEIGKYTYSLRPSLTLTLTDIDLLFLVPSCSFCGRAYWMSVCSLLFLESRNFVIYSRNTAFILFFRKITI